MVTRRQGREWALQLLVQFDLNPLPSVSEAIDEFWEQQADLEREPPEEEGVVRRRVIFTSKNVKKLESLAQMRDFTETRVKGVMCDRARLDTLIEGYLRNWSLYRLGTVERNVLRLGFWELTHCPDIPAPIVINECVDLVKFFSETKGGRFVNGVLDRFSKNRVNLPQDYTP